jgi:sialate O-acetylesterase
VPDFPGVPYFFARDLQKKLGIPVGIVHLAVPGTDIELHMNPATVRSILPQSIELELLQKQFYPELKKAFDEKHAAWKTEKGRRRKSGKSVPAEPKAPRNPDRPDGPGTLFNGMVAPRRAVHRERVFVVAGRKQRGPCRAISRAFPISHRRLAQAMEQ